MRLGTPIAFLVLVLTLNSTLLFFSHLLQQSSSRLYHHGEGKSYMNIHIATSPDSAEHSQGASYDSSPTAFLDSAVGALSTSFDNLAGANFEYRLKSPPVDIVYTWVNGSDPRHARGMLHLNHSHFSKLLTHII